MKAEEMLKVARFTLEGYSSHWQRAAPEPIEFWKTLIPLLEREAEREAFPGAVHATAHRKLTEREAAIVQAAASLWPTVPYNPVDFGARLNWSVDTAEGIVEEVLKRRGL